MPTRIRGLAVLLVLASIGVLPAAEPPLADPPAASKTLEQRLNATLKDLTNRGADMYNAGDPAGCYHMFQGALLTAKPLLDARPEIQKAIDAGMAEAAREADFRRRAWALRRTLDDVRSQLAKADDKKEPDKKDPDKKDPEDKKEPDKKEPDKKEPDKKEPDKKDPDKKEPDK